MGYWVGIDVGGTNIVCGLLDDSGKLIAKIKRPTHAHLGNDHVIERMADMVTDIIAEQGLMTDDIQAVGAGMPGFVDPVQGVVLDASNLNMRNVPVADPLSRLLDLPVCVDNDVRMYIYGEALRGAGQGFDHVLGVTIGTGIASALVSHGQLYYGGGFMAGEIGHVRMRGLTQNCICGNIGCLETVASASGIIRAARKRIAAGGASLLEHWHQGNLSRITALDVSNAYDLGDPVAIEVLHEAGKRLGEALSYAISILSPDIIVIGGGVAMAGARIFDAMQEEIRNSVVADYWDRLKIKTALRLDDAGVIGSALHAQIRFASGAGYD